MLPHSISAVVARNEAWEGESATEPYEAGWAREAMVFVRALKPPVGELPNARIQVSADGIRWIDNGVGFPLPRRLDETTFVAVDRFGGWLRVAADLPPGARLDVLITIHLK